ncbi:hypothetical protein JR316_0003224 [Psilocybe cubensis]|uniref:NYN domain-containing protein n=2 Tax=Psilocybe cubensis TaxID=181762 RepID=A0A8H7Y0D1_PSICU|nr:hypothetical protein JR316_0003224 [Psilocybe cubensis]KAH9483748.1 hypothetical protein JR316_0003224 [Psilocybe cubensis]
MTKAILDNVAIFWDYEENCPVPSNTSGYAAVDCLRNLAEPYGSVRSLKAYLEVTEQTPSKTLLMRSELQSSGVSLVDCPHNGRKDVADKMIIVDMLAHALDNPVPSTIILITGDRDFAYAMSILRLRRYRLVLVTLPHAHPSLTSQASVCLRWTDIVMSLSNDDTPANVFEPVASVAPAPVPMPKPSSIEVPPIHMVTNSPRDMFNKLTPETVGPLKQFESDLPTIPRPRWAYPSYPLDCAPSPSKTPLATEQRLATALSWSDSVYLPKTSPPPSPKANPISSNVVQTEVGIPHGDTPFFKGLNRPFVAPTGIDISHSSPRPSNTSMWSHKNANAASSSTNVPRKPFCIEASSILGNSFPIDAQAPLSTVEISSERTVPDPVVPDHFKVLVQILQKCRAEGNIRPLRSIIGLEVAKANVFKKVGVERFKQYVMIAVKLGIVEVGGKDGGAWINLKPEWANAK